MSSVCHFALLPWSSAAPIIRGLEEQGPLYNIRPQPSSKVVALLQVLKQVPEGDKVVIVSDFVKLLELISPCLEAEGYKAVFYTGEQSTKEKTKSLERFRTEKSIDCLLMSLKAGGAGLNITEANHMVIMDLAWNPATESQCLGRVHRIGQTREVFCTRLVVEGTVEDRMREVQSGKRKIEDELLNVLDGDGKDRILDLDQMNFLVGLQKARLRDRPKGTQGEDFLDEEIQKM